MAEWHVYILRCADGSLYTGVTTDPERRLAEHTAGPPRGAKYLRTRRPLELVFSAIAPSRAMAQRTEHAIKQLPRRDKVALVRGVLSIGDIAAPLPSA